MSHARTLSTFHAWAGALALLIGCLAAVGLSPAHAGFSPATNDGDDGPGKLVLLMDSSGSMKEPTSGGGTKIDAAKQALRRLTGELPPDQEVGLRVFGATVFEKSQPGACEDSQLVAPMGTDNRAQLRTAIDRYKPYGETPISYALQQAAKDLGDTGSRNIVLVSDGEPTCPPDPCQVAKEIRKSGIDLRIDVVGLDVNSAARSTLQCIADSGGGLYYDAASAQELSDALSHLAERAARSYQPIGELVTGGTAPESAAEVTAGDWIDPTGNDAAGNTEGAERFYRVTRQFRDSTITAGAATLSPLDGGDTFVQTQILTESGDSCDMDSALANAGQLVTAAVKASQYDSSCLDEEALIVGVTVKNGRRGAPVELAFRETPSADPLPTSAVTTTTWTNAQGKSAKAAGGTSFADATAIDPGLTPTTIVPGELLTYSVDLDYGDTVSVDVKVPALRGAMSALGDATAKMDVSLYSPSRSQVDTASGTPTEDFALLTRSGTRVASLSPPVDFASLNNSEWQVFEPGSYTIVLQLAKAQPSLELPVTLGVAVGSQDVTEPSLTEVPYAQGPESESPSTSESSEPAATDTTESPAAGDDDSEKSSSDDSSVSPLVLGLGGLVLLALLVGGFLALRGRTRRS